MEQKVKEQPDIDPKKVYILQGPEWKKISKQEKKIFEKKANDDKERFIRENKSYEKHGFYLDGNGIKVAIPEKKNELKRKLDIPPITIKKVKIG